MPRVRVKAIIPKPLRLKEVSSDVKTAVRDWQIRVLRPVQTYPSPPSDAYDRTGTYKRGWRTPTPSLTGGQLLAQVTNNVEYAGWVGGPEQTKVHERTGWQRADELGARELKRLIDDIAAAIRKQDPG